MNQTVKLAIAALTAALATSIAVAAPADAAPAGGSHRTQDCC